MSKFGKTFLTLALAVVGIIQAHASISFNANGSAASCSAPAGLSCVTTLGNAFVMLDPTAGLTGDDPQVTLTWDGTYNTAVAGAQNNAALSSPNQFQGSLWIAHDIKVFAPGAYTIGGYTFTVGAGQVGLHMLFDWGTNQNISVAEVCQQGSFQDATSATSVGPWDCYSTDPDGDATSGIPMYAGPFMGFNANFNVNGLTAATTPTVSSKAPAAGAVAVATNAGVTVTFSQAMNDASVQSAFTVTTGGGATICTSVTTTDHLTYTCNHPALTGTTIYTATVSTAANAASNVPLAALVSWSFTTAAGGDATPPTVSSKTPANGAAGVAASTSISITFNEPMAGTTAAAMSVAAGGAVAGSFSTADNITFTFAPTSGSLPNSSTIVVTVPASVTDSAGNALGASPAWSFTTVVPASLSSGSVTMSSTGANPVSLTTQTTSSVLQQAGTLNSTTVPPMITWDTTWVNFKVNGVTGSATVRIAFPASISGKDIYNFNSTTGVFTKLTAGTGLNQYQVVNATTIDLLIQDGGPLDADGTVNGVIVDPVGSGTTPAPVVIAEGGGAGGGCVADPVGKDAGLLVVLLVILGYVSWRRRQS